MVLWVGLVACGDDGDDPVALDNQPTSATSADTDQLDTTQSDSEDSGSESTGSADSTNPETGSGEAVDPGWGSEQDAAAALQWWSSNDGANLGWQTAEAWERYPGTTELRVGMEPHGARQNLWHTTDPAEGQVGYTVLKENYPPEGDGDELVAVTIGIKREAGYDPDNQDWFWTRFNPDGTLFMIGELPAAGAVEPEPGAGCRGCHRAAADGDYTYVND